jgi:hypothetical protein
MKIGINKITITTLAIIAIVCGYLFGERYPLIHRMYTIEIKNESMQEIHVKLNTQHAQNMYVTIKPKAQHTATLYKGLGVSSYELYANYAGGKQYIMQQSVNLNAQHYIKVYAPNKITIHKKIRLLDKDA